MSTSILGLDGRRIDLEVVVRIGATAALLASATVHSTLAAEHLGELSRAGTLFLVLQLVETSLAMAVISAWSFTTAAAVVATSVVSVGIWAWSSVTGMPLSPESFRISWLAGSDLGSLALELTAAGLALPWAVRAWSAWRAGRRRARRRRARLGS
jgi:hypothetical protein